MNAESLEREFEYYLSNQGDIVEKHDGKVIVVRDCQIVGEYDDEATAFTDAVQKFERGTFLIQRVSAGDEAYTATFFTPGIAPG